MRRNGQTLGALSFEGKLSRASLRGQASRATLDSAAASSSKMSDQ